MFRILFKQVKLGCSFNLNGNRFIKVSSRTAKLVEFNRVFYIGMNDSVLI